jgi:biopolymer transport protein TolQ
MLHQVSGAGGLGVVQLVLGTGPVVAFVLWLLVAFSVGSWGIILYKLIQISRARRESEKFIAIFWESKNLAAIHTASVGLKNSPVSQVFRAGYQELLQLTRAKRQAVGSDSGFSTDLGGIANVMRAMKRQENVELTKLESGITFLATTGSSAPFIGLFGTVVGILTAFQSMAIMGTGGFSVVAAGISEALISTALGLAVAIIAVIFYNYFSVRIDNLNAVMHVSANHLINAALEGRHADGA